MGYTLKNVYMSCLRFKAKLILWNTNQRRGIVLSCSKRLSALLRGTTSKHFGVFYCLNCLHYSRRKSKLESRNKVCDKKDFCNVVIPSEDTKILEFNLRV